MYDQALGEKEVEARELRVQITDMEESTNELHNKFEAALLVVEEQSKEKEAELEAANREIQRLGDRVFELEDEIDRTREGTEQWKDEVMAETARLEGTVSALKDVSPKLSYANRLINMMLLETIEHQI
jgi:predicted  nucleic acid-binding Zn-ribbon protein